MDLHRAFQEVHGHLGVEKVQALLGELKGFECLIVVEIVPLSDDLATLDRVDVRHANLGLDAAYPATDPPVHAGHNLVSRPEEFSEERFVLPLPGLLEAFEEAADRGPTIDGSRLYPRHRGRHLGVWGIQLDEGVEVAAIPGVEPTARDVHSIVGHLSGSMPQRSSSDRRGSRYGTTSERLALQSTDDCSSSIARVSSPADDAPAFGDLQDPRCTGVRTSFQLSAVLMTPANRASSSEVPATPPAVTSTRSQSQEAVS